MSSVVQPWSGLNEVPADWGRCVVLIGVLDGVHRGHAHLIDRAHQAAARRGLPLVAITFDPHPAELLAPHRAPAMLTTVDRRVELLVERGIDQVLLLRFTQEFADLSATQFVDDVLGTTLHAVEVVVGRNFTFGRGGTGTADALIQLGAERGFAVDAVELAEGAASPVSSTRIRYALSAGEVEQVTELLGRPYRADGIVVRGEQRGRELGYPTANIEMAANAAVPADGVYAGRVVRLDGTAEVLGTAAISVGTNPTFDGQQRTVEAFILDFDADLYGDRLGVEFTHRLRGMVRFDSIDALIVQMDADVARARALAR
jgi:riboflavin kinase/FMN adenylyltransferase